MIIIDRIHYNSYAQSYAFHIIQQQRRAITLAVGESAGYRFNDDQWVLCCLESHSTPEDFGLDPVGTVDLALHEAARTDYWYSTERHYEFDEEMENYEEEAE